MNYALELRQIHKNYRDHEVLKDLNLQVPGGRIYGFLGRNGAGKTTTIRIITGLVKQSAGSVFILGKDAKHNRVSAMRSIGAIVESPAFYPNLTGIENLRITRDLLGAEKNRIDEVLAIVDMARHARRKVKTYSTGMRQRLGIANALIHAPRILILDEPTNGLDPNGVKDLRALIQSLSREMEITVLVSSHILSEIEQIADQVGILDRGRLVDQFSMRELDEQEQSGLLLEVENPQKAEALLKDAGLTIARTDRQIQVFCRRAQNAQVNALMASNGIAILNLNSVKNNLEDRFFAVVGRETNDVEG